MFWKLIINLQMLFAACDLRAVTPLALFYFLSKDFSPFWSVSCRRNELVSKA